MTGPRIMTRTDAEISPCGRFRYKLWRQWAPGTICCWLMLNPSKAGPVENDPTVLSCVDFASMWGHGGIVVANMFAYRATRPRQLRDIIRSRVWSDNPGPCPTGDPRNREAIRECCEEAAVIVAAWGTHAHSWMPDRPRLIQMDVEALGRKMVCLGRTRDGHPLYVKRNTPLEVYQ